MSDETHARGHPLSYHNLARGFVPREIPPSDLDAGSEFDHCKVPTEEDLVELQMDIKSLTMKHEATEAELANLRFNHEGAQNELQRVKDENGFLKALIADPDMHKGCIAQKNAIAEDLNAKIKDLQEELQYVHKANSDAQVDALNAEVKCNKMSFELENLEEKVKQLRSELAEAQIKLCILEAEKQALMEDMTKHQATGKDMNTQDISLEEPELLNEASSISQKDVNDIHDKLQASQSDMKKLKQALKKTRRQQKTACKDAEEVAEKSHVQDQKITELQAEIKSLRETQAKFQELFDLSHKTQPSEALPRSRNALDVGGCQGILDILGEGYKGSGNKVKSDEAQAINDVSHGYHGHPLHPQKSDVLPLADQTGASAHKSGAKPLFPRNVVNEAKAGGHGHGNTNMPQSMESSTPNLRDLLGGLNEEMKNTKSALSMLEQRSHWLEKLYEQNS